MRDKETTSEKYSLKWLGNEFLQDRKRALFCVEEINPWTTRNTGDVCIKLNT